ncbi:ClcB-like voltage-gated chloride channel protein [Mycetohabitans rhizoxinica]|uniref:ClcB-like voltage-gated chloride channel protein n=1 Tax=Mycetohabitans rhizoxinica TaxID=412963 RepID=UPI0030CBFE98
MTHRHRAVLAFLLRLRTRAQRLFKLSDKHTILLWATLAGLVGTAATLVFRLGIDWLESLIDPNASGLVQIARDLPWYARLALPSAGGAVAGMLLLAARRNDDGKGHADYMEAMTIGEGVVPVRQSLWRSGSSLVTIASGGSIGREGSMVQLAALSASLLGRLVHVDPERLRLLVACGAAAGITSAYSAPIAGALFVTEIVLGSIAMESFGPIIVSSVVANVTMRALSGYQAPYEMPPFPAISGLEVLWFVGLGILCGMLAPAFLLLLSASRRLFGRWIAPLPWRLALGGALVGALSIQAPQVWGNGYSVVNAILHQPWTWQALVAVLVLKVAATCATAGSGAVGGIFTPTLFVGAALGAIYGLAAHAHLPLATSAPLAYAIVGMGAFLAAATHAPLMAILMIFEMTLSYQVVLPLMLASVIAYFIARALAETSMYEVTLRRNRERRERLRLKATQMRELVRPADTVLGLDASVADMTRVFLEYPVKYIYIVDAAGWFQGVVALKDITSDLLDKHGPRERRARDYLRRDFAALTPDMPLAAALQHFLAFQGERLPVVASTQAPKLLGVVYKTALLQAYFQMNASD